MGDMRALIAGLYATLSWSAGLQAAEVNVAVAANFTAPMQKIAEAFTQDTGHRTVLAFGSTGKFYAQIKNGAPFEILLAADATTPASLEQEGLGVSGSRFTYAVGKLVLWSKQPGLVDDQGAVLRTGKFDHIALANPKLAPYGAAAWAVLTKLGLLGAVQPKFVQGDSIAQAYQFVATGNAALGFVALSQVYSDGHITEGTAWIVPTEWYEPLQQEALLLNNGKGNLAAASLLHYLRSDAARRIISAYGYSF